MLFAGFNVAEGDVLALVAVVAVGVAGEPRRLVDRLRASATSAASTCSRSTASSCTSSPSHLEWADRWFERYGDATVFFSRMLPIIRTFISLPAGVARMPFWRFTLLTRRSAASRGSSCSTFIGKQVGDNWEDWKDSCTTSTTRSPR